TDDPVWPRRGQQRLELGPRARRVKMPPRDRRETRVPIPLPAIAARARTRVRERHTITLTDDPVPVERLAASRFERRHAPHLCNRAARCLDECADARDVTADD